MALYSELLQARMKKSKLKGELDSNEHLLEFYQNKAEEALLTPEEQKKTEAKVVECKAKVNDLQAQVAELDKRITKLMINIPETCKGKKPKHEWIRSPTEDYCDHTAYRCKYCGEYDKEYHATSTPDCLIATAAYGTPLDPRIDTFRDYRNKYMSDELTQFYYDHSPPIAQFIKRHRTARLLTRAVLTPLVVVIERINERPGEPA